MTLNKLKTALIIALILSLLFNFIQHTRWYTVYNWYATAYAHQINNLRIVNVEWFLHEPNPELRTKALEGLVTAPQTLNQYGEVLDRMHGIWVFSYISQDLAWYATDIQYALSENLTITPVPSNEDLQRIYEVWKIYSKHITDELLLEAVAPRIHRAYLEARKEIKAAGLLDALNDQRRWEIARPMR